MKNLIKLHVDNLAREKRAVFNAAKGTGPASLYIYDIISADYGVGAMDVIEAVALAKDSPELHVYINSPGGDVFEGRAMMAALERFPGKTVAHIDSLCASAATSIALACNEVEISDGAFFMIHNASGMAWGDKNTLRTTADLLEKIEGSIVADYTKKTGKDEAQVVQWMNDETWFTAAEAIENGFVDRLASKATAKNTWNLASFDRAPQALREAPQPEPEQPASTPDTQDMKTANTNRLRLLTIA